MNKYRNQKINIDGELSEREQDQRDLDILADLDEGHGEQSVADYWGVSRNHVRALKWAARAAG